MADGEGSVTVAGSSNFEPVIGLEIHVQLATRTKMFCGCELGFGEEPNTRTCPICLGHPGVLPVTNEGAVHLGLMMALALGCEIAPRSTFHRKNYFYPDLPKGYQISQYDEPLATGGRLGDVRIHRAHMEEDAAKLTHLGESGRIHGASSSLVDFNRGGTPLVEIVTEPDIYSPEQAREWAQLLRATVRRIGVSDANMEEGSLRIDANVSIRPRGEQQLGTKTELKNINSFRFVERGLKAEIARQIELVEAGGKVEQATLHFDPGSGTLTSLRSKEEAHDYHYFPEPDLVPVRPTEEMIEAARAAIPELPAEHAERLESEFGISAGMARTLVADMALASFFEEALAAEPNIDPRALAAVVTGELVAKLRESDLQDPYESKATPASVGALVAMTSSGAVSSTASVTILDALVKHGGDPKEIVEAEGLGAIGDDPALEAIVERAIASEPEAVEKIRAGKKQAVGVLVGAVMRETKGRADGKLVNEIIARKLAG